jgi:hypothetical protein
MGKALKDKMKQPYGHGTAWYHEKRKDHESKRGVKSKGKALKKFKSPTKYPDKFISEKEQETHD